MTKYLLNVQTEQNTHLNHICLFRYKYKTKNMERVRQDTTNSVNLLLITQRADSSITMDSA